MGFQYLERKVKNHNATVELTPYPDLHAQGKGQKA